MPNPSLKTSTGFGHPWNMLSWLDNTKVRYSTKTCSLRRRLRRQVIGYTHHVPRGHGGGYIGALSSDCLGYCGGAMPRPRLSSPWIRSHFGSSANGSSPTPATACRREDMAGNMWRLSVETYTDLMLLYCEDDSTAVKQVSESDAIRLFLQGFKLS